MPAPSSNSIAGFLTQALIGQGLTRKAFDESGNIVDSGELQDDMKKIVNALAIGLANQWAAWQATQSVTVTSVTAVTPGLGVSGPGSGSLP